MKMEVEQVAVREGESIGLVVGRPVGDATKQIIVGIEVRMAISLGEALIAADEPIVAEYEDWQVLAIRELP